MKKDSMMYKKRINSYKQPIVWLLFMCIFYSLVLPYSLFNPISTRQEIMAEDQLSPVLAFSLCNTFYLPLKETSVVETNILAFAAEMVSFVFNNTVKNLNLNLPGIAAQQNPGYSHKVPTWLKMRLLRI